jgi:hypothetical protein
MLSFMIINSNISRKCHSLYKKELFKLLLSGLDIVIISLDDLVFLISPNFYSLMVGKGKDDMLL